MATYICKRCDHKTDRKFNMINHITRKNLCQNVKNISDTEEQYEIIEKEKKSKFCSHCKKEFYNSTNRKKHEITCKIKLTDTQSVNSIPYKPKNGYIYLLKIYPYNENIYKIGKTENIKRRILDYKSLRPLIKLVVECENITLCETEILKIFNDSFIQQKEIGSEFFVGDELEMTNKIYTRNYV